MISRFTFPHATLQRYENNTTYIVENGGFFILGNHQNKLISDMCNKKEKNDCVYARGTRASSPAV